jgi:hypothetical protein
MTQLTPDHFEVIDSNKARNYERKKSEQQRKHELFIDGRDQLDKIANAYNKAENKEIKEVYKKKWFDLVKLYAEKIKGEKK